MIRAVIDIGSNSIKMRIASITGRKIRVIRDETEVVRLSRGMSSTGRLSDESMRRSCDSVVRMIHKARHLGAEIFIAGTMALRTAENAGDFVRMVREASGCEVHVFSGEEEAKYSWLGAVDGLRLEGNTVMFDSGGGSTEFVSGSGNEVKRLVSIPVGAVNLSEKFFSDYEHPIKKSVCDSAVGYVRDLFTRNNIADFREDLRNVIGVGGGVSAMAAVKTACELFMPSKIHGLTLTRRDIITQIRIYASLTLKEREQIIGLPASRADVILGSACIIFTALELLRVSSCTVSINGLRHGLLIRDNIM